MVKLLESDGAFLDAESVGYLGDAELAGQMFAEPTLVSILKRNRRLPICCRSTRFSSIK
jgi:hypothetical protein